MSMPDPVITEQGEPVAIELLYYRQRQPLLIEVDSLEDGRERAESIEDHFEGSTVALVVGGEIRELLGYSAEDAAEALAEARRLEASAP